MSQPLFDPGAAAWLSDDGTYRYTLRRRWGPGAPLVWIMLNPSTADHRRDDPTVRRVARFTRDAGHHAFAVVNLYALRATNPDDLRHHPDPIGGCINDIAIWACARQGPVVAAWGAKADAARVRDVVANPLAGHDLLCLGSTLAGHPRHPLYVRADQALTPWERTT